MKKVKYVYRGYSELTYNKVYDVLRHIPATSTTSEMEEVLNDSNRVIRYRMVYGKSSLPQFYYFVDVTTEYMNDIIDGILS